MKRILNSMLAFWILLLGVSLGAAGVVYELWLSGRM